MVLELEIKRAPSFQYWKGSGNEDVDRTDQCMEQCYIVNGNRQSLQDSEATLSLRDREKVPITPPLEAFQQDQLLKLSLQNRPIHRKLSCVSAKVPSDL